MDGYREKDRGGGSRREGRKGVEGRRVPERPKLDEVYYCLPNLGNTTAGRLGNRIVFVLQGSISSGCGLVKVTLHVRRRAWTVAVLHLLWRRSRR